MGWSPDGTRLACCSWRTIQIFDSRPGQQRQGGVALTPGNAPGLLMPRTALPGDDDAAEAARRQELEAQSEPRREAQRSNRGIDNSLAALGRDLEAQSKLAEAAVVWRGVLALRRQWLDRSDPDVLAALAELVAVLHAQNKPAERDDLMFQLEALCPAALAQCQAFATNRSRHNECWSFAISYERLGQTLKQIGRTQQAEKAYRDTQALWDKLVSSFNLVDDRWHLAINQDALGALLRDAGRRGEAAQAYRSALAIWEKLAAETQLEDHRNHRLWTLGALADVLCQEGKLAEAEAMCGDLARSGNVMPLNNLAWRLATSPDANERSRQTAARLAEEAVALTGRTNALFLDTLAAAYATAGQYTNAVKVQQEAISLLRAEQEKKDYATRLRLYEAGVPYRDAGALAERARQLLEARRFTEAEPPARECLALRERLMPDDWRTFNARSLLGGSLLGQKKYAEAEPLLVAGYEGLKQREDKMPAAGKPRLKEALQRLVQLYEATGRTNQAAEWRRKLAEADTPAAATQRGAP